MPELQTEAKPSGLKRLRDIAPFGLSLLFLLLCVLVQYSTGAWSAAFTAYPDEPSHFISSVMIRDYFASGMTSSPMSFARSYYSHYPFFAVGYWPPFYYLVTAITFLVLGVGRAQALVVSALAAAGSATMLVILLRKRCGLVIACCASFVFLSLPEVQHWFSAVMTDEMVAFLCLAAGVRLLIYLERPTAGNAVFCGICCACAVLTKYSAAYICVVPVATCLLLRRFDIMKKPSFLILHATFAAVAGPWILATMHGMATGLPSVQSDPVTTRIVSSACIAFSVFPLPLMIFVLLGLVALILLHTTWHADVVVIALLFVGSFSLVIASPVDPEPRYFLGTAAALLALAFAGWAAALNRTNASAVVSALAVVLTIAFMATHLGAYPRTPNSPIGSIVRAVISNPAWAGKRIIVASDFEGPMIAEFAVQDHARPGYMLLRPSKLFSDEDWFGKRYVSRYDSVQKLAASFTRKNPADLIIWHSRPSYVLRTHERLMEQMLNGNSLSWRKSASLPVAGSDGSTWSVYEFVSGEAY
jgi:4-amino-4-deoxy-L-arabinose transferase-like glycosyltransferase